MALVRGSGGLHAGDKQHGPAEEEAWVGEAVDQRGEDRAKSFPALRAAFHTAVEQFGPNDFFVSTRHRPLCRCSPEHVGLGLA